MSLNRVTIVTVTYNSAAVIGPLLASLAGCDVIVVDNGSTDGTRAAVRRHAGARLIEGANIGYGAAANRGFAQVATPYAMLVNPDVTIAPDAISAMAAHMDANHDIGIVGANFSGVAGPGLFEVPWISGALMLIRMEMLQKTGGFDERIFLFYEETDLCHRFVDAGWRIAVAEDAMATHIEGRSSAPSLHVLRIKAFHAAWSKCYYFRKHFSRAMYRRKAFGKLLQSMLRLLKSCVSFNRAGVVRNTYECLGVLAYMVGMSAFKNGVGRLT